ncbi:Eaa1 [Klebsiella pneumoniae]|nr:Eaa1 [Klebsiella pneumoniae]
MTSKLTRMTDDELTETLRLATSGYPLPVSTEENLRLAFAELQERRKAEKDSKPVAWTDEEELRDANAGACGYLFGIGCAANKFADPRRQIMLYRHAQPAAEREQVRSAHAEWSQATFGNVGPVGPLKHLSKEALEAAEQPGDLSEWADMQFLLWDAQRRAGITDEQITQAMIDKLAVNKQRSWPEPKDGEPKLHIKERSRKKVDRCDVCTEGARGGCGTCIFNGNFE